MKRRRKFGNRNESAMLVATKYLKNYTAFSKHSNKEVGK